MRQISPTLTATGKKRLSPRGKFTKREFHNDSALNLKRAVVRPLNEDGQQA
jgi:hypothetical protein